MESTRQVLKIALCLSIGIGIVIPTPTVASWSWFWPTRAPVFPSSVIPTLQPLSTFEHMCKPLVDPISLCGVNVPLALLIAGGALLLNSIMLYNYWRAKQNARVLAMANQQLTDIPAKRMPIELADISTEERQQQIQAQEIAMKQLCKQHADEIQQMQEQIKILQERQQRVVHERELFEQKRIDQLDEQNRDLQNLLDAERDTLTQNQTLMREQTTQLNQLQADHKRIYQEHAQVYATLGQLQEERARIHGLFETIYNAISPLRTTLVNCPHVVCQKLNREWPGQSISQLASILLGLERTRTPSPASNGNGNRNNGHALLPATPRRPAATNNSHNGNRRTAVQTAGRGNAGKGNQAVHPPIRAHT